jgi:hypothetical protein
MSTLLKLLGFNAKKPLEFLLKMLGVVGKERLTKELAEALKKRTTPARRSVLISNFRSIATDLEKGDYDGCATKFVEVLFSIKF